MLTLKSSPTLRVIMAAGLYLLLMWGYAVLTLPQMFAVFAAIVMSIALLFWVSEARAIERLSLALEQCALDQPASQCNSPESETDPSLNASIVRLDSLKMELTRQYAQFGRDQSLMNRNGLGSWHRNRGQHGDPQ